MNVAKFPQKSNNLYIVAALAGVSFLLLFINFNYIAPDFYFNFVLPFYFETFVDIIDTLARVSFPILVGLCAIFLSRKNCLFLLIPLVLRVVLSVFSSILYWIIYGYISIGQEILAILPYILIIIPFLLSSIGIIANKQINLFIYPAIILINIIICSFGLMPFAFKFDYYGYTAYFFSNLLAYFFIVGAYFILAYSLEIGGEAKKKDKYNLYEQFDFENKSASFSKVSPKAPSLNDYSSFEVSNIPINAKNKQNEINSSNDNVRRIKEIKALYEEGLITKEEFEIKRRKIIDKI